MTKASYIIRLCINAVSFIMYGIDKYKARKGKWRISEATLLTMAVAGGSVGAWLGMKVRHHKTMHKKFKYGDFREFCVYLRLQTVYKHIQKNSNGTFKHQLRYSLQ